jgi:hypothetical protein
MWRWLVSRGERRARRKRRAWLTAGRPLPVPSSIKHEILGDHADRYGLHTLVETGTFRGGTIEALRDRFARIYSIELDDTLYERARRRFADVPHVTILHGDSALMLPTVLAMLGEPALFWLDGHYSGPGTAKGRRETPIEEEIRAVLAHPVAGHVILVDDARVFGSWPDYPTIDEFRRLVAAVSNPTATTRKPRGASASRPSPSRPWPP